jgi:hypothetical protein
VRGLAAAASHQRPVFSFAGPSNLQFGKPSAPSRVSFGSPAGPADAGVSSESPVQPPATMPPPNEGAPLVNTSRGSAPDGMQQRVIPSSPSSFVAKMSKPLPHTVLSPVPCARRHAGACPAPAVPRRSSHLAKKARGRTPAGGSHPERAHEEAWHFTGDAIADNRLRGIHHSRKDLLWNRQT